MRKIILLIAAVMLFSVQGFSQAGIKAGLNFNSAEALSFDNTIKSNLDNKTGFHVGLLYNFKIPLTGFSIQPELMFVQNKSEFENATKSGEFTTSTSSISPKTKRPIP